MVFSSQHVVLLGKSSEFPRKKLGVSSGLLALAPGMYSASLFENASGARRSDRGNYARANTFSRSSLTPLGVCGAVAPRDGAYGRWHAGPRRAHHHRPSHPLHLARRVAGVYGAGAGGGGEEATVIRNEPGNRRTRKTETENRRMGEAETTHPS